jgi:membrane protein DedA with SNARE-associated domain
MDEAVSYLIRHGYAVLFVWVTVEQFVLPVPSEPVLLASGALAGAGQLQLPVAVIVGVAGALLADVVWYEIGRTRGSQVLRWLCRISLEPDSCVRQSQERFARYGARSLLVAKFVPGLNTVAQPLAGILGMPRRRFLAFDALGALLWIGSYMALGYAFSDQLERVAAHGERLGTWGLALLLGALVLYVGVKYAKRQRFIRQLRIARITPAELKQKLDAGEPVMIVDLRHSLDFAADPAVIPGAIHLTPDEIERRAAEIPRDRQIVVYCT